MQQAKGICDVFLENKRLQKSPLFRVEKNILGSAFRAPGPAPALQSQQGASFAPGSYCYAKTAMSF